MKKKLIGLIPARSGSLRVRNKNKLALSNHPMIAYSIKSAYQSELFSKVVIASDDEEILEIGKYYGVDEIFKRDASDSQSDSLDIEWLTNLFNTGIIDSEIFAILRPTSPQRSAQLIRSCYKAFIESNCDSLRTVCLVKDHPGKMWRLSNNGIATPYLSQNFQQPATHALQYQSLEKIYIQTSVLEMAWTRVITETKSREGKSVFGYVTTGLDALAIDTQEDLLFIEMLVNQKKLELPLIDGKPWAYKND